jgi:chemotaxis response regulator CheB
MWLVALARLNHHHKLSCMLSQYLVAIGGSAGSLIPLQHFFERTPVNNASYIIVRHLPKEYKSKLALILDRHSKLQVIEARPGAPILNNKIYYAPPGYHIVLYDGFFRLLKRNGQTRNKSVDILLESLALNENCPRSIAIILSGEGDDGTRGAAAVKKAGGIVIAQLPSSCEFPSMPLHVIKKGLAQYVLLPEEMPALIKGFADRIVATT